MSVAARKKPSLQCSFYRTPTGNEPVRDWLKSLEEAVRKEIGADIGQVQWRWPVGKPLVDGFGNGLFEVRTSLDGNIYRVLFCLDGAIMVLFPRFPEEDPEDAQGRRGPRSETHERRGKSAMKKKYIGSTLDSLFEELGERENIELLTQKKLLAAKIEKAMARRKK